jgi:hypothetical protein
VIDVTVTITLPEIRGMPKAYWDEVASIVAIGIVDNIVKQKQANGSKLKPNPDGYKEKKRAMGRGTRSLVDEKHRFVQGGDGSWKVTQWHAANTGITIGPATTELEGLVRYNWDRGYKGYIGVSRETKLAILALTQEWFIRMCKTGKKSTKTIKSGG